MRTLDNPATAKFRPFGRVRPIVARAAEQTNFADDLRLFAMTFAGGFLFVTVFLA